MQDESDIETIFRDHEHAFDGARTLNTTRLSDIQPKPISWLWPGRIARGKVTIIAGNPGLGKSQITASIAAIISTGACWPVHGRFNECSDVLFLTAEDDAADTLRPRLEAAGADVKRTHIVEGVGDGFVGEGANRNRLFSLADDLELLSEKLSCMPEVAALVIDPISAYLGETDSHKNAEVRSLLASVSELAGRHNIAIIGISHLTKATGKQALMRVSGSLAFVAAARAVYLVTHDQNDHARRLLLPLKNNLGPDGTGLAYRIEPATVPSAAGFIETSRVVWEPNPVTITADEAMQTQRIQKPSALKEAEEWLKEVLADQRSMPSNELFGLAEEHGISLKTVRRAAKQLGIKPTKASMQGGWEWILPTEDAQVS